jgi:hypothetical protein
MFMMSCWGVFLPIERRQRGSPELEGLQLLMRHRWAIRMIRERFCGKTGVNQN